MAVQLPVPMGLRGSTGAGVCLLREPANKKDSRVLDRLKETFRRVTTSGGYVAEIDGLRFIAIAAVVAVHVVGYWLGRAGRTYPAMSVIDRALESFVLLGIYGVHLFFMISGFVLAMPFCKHAFAGGKPVNLRNYFCRRVTRLEPPYIITMLGFFALMPFFGKGTWTELWPHLLASLAYVHNIVYGESSLINNNAWSLEIEIQFYLLMPVVAGALVLPPWPRRVLLAVLAVFLSLNRLWLPVDAPQSILQFGQYFVLGILLCDAWTNSWQGLPRSVAADVPGLLAWPLFAWNNLRNTAIVADLLNPWVIGFLFYSALRGRWHGRVLAFGPIPIIGGMCYSMYLLHARVLAAVIHGILAKLPSLGSFTADYCLVLPLASLAVVAVSAVFFVLVEKPCMDPGWPTKALEWLRGSRGRPMANSFPADQAS
jgi:peptidoglycan/LPS O-acetylase OafA/YrhL